MVVKQLALQGSSFRGHDESDDSLNPGNVLAWIGFAAKLNDQINSVVLRNAPGNEKYTSPSIQKEILGIIANRVRSVDEAGREQMSIILRLQLALITSAKLQLDLFPWQKLNFKSYGMKDGTSYSKR
ncbi:unnamed protein product [Linum trigynum]|uniref:DUF4371 domain-containing protein n=1 Tax=Linum trigynum TaxID=586398 RepID=A0AAV2GRJ5_9ROSI